MNIVLHPGEALRVMFHGTDGDFLVAFDTPEYPYQIRVEERAGLPGSKKGEANAVLYLEEFDVGGDKPIPPA